VLWFGGSFHNDQQLFLTPTSGVLDFCLKNKMVSETINMAPSNSEDEASSHPDNEEDDHSESEQEIEDNSDNDNDDDDDDDDEEEEEQDVDSDGNKVVSAKRPKKIHRLSLTETENFNEKLKKRGVLYIARIPPKLTPTKIKSLLSEFCEVTRVYLVPEDASVRKRRKKEHGRSGGKRYREGWVEMASKKKAKRIAMSLNNSQISNTKRNPHYGKLVEEFLNGLFCRLTFQA
jgi:hypothetical protein